MKTLVISAFPGMGKSTTYNEYLEKVAKDPAWWVWDSDSSKFDKSEFPQNYIEHIKDGIKQTVAIIFVSSHEEVRQAMTDAGIDFIVCYPNKNRKEEFLKNYKERGSSESFIALLDSKWEEWIDAFDAGDICFDEGFINLDWCYSLFENINKGELSN